MKRLIMMISVLVVPALAIAGTSNITGNLAVTADATIGDDLTLSGATESIILDSSAGGSGLIVTEGLITPSDEELRLDSETQNVTVGDGTNDTVFSDDGKITQTGGATLTLQDGSDLIVTANANAGPFLSAGSADTATGALTFTGTHTLNCPVVYEPSAVVVIDTSTDLTVTDRYMLVLATASTEIVSDATPFISTTTYTQGTIVTVMNTGGTLTLSDNSQVAGSLLELDGNTVALTNLSNITLYLKGNKWVQVGGVNIVD